LTYYTATKNSFTLPEITIGQDKIHGSSAHTYGSIEIHSLLKSWMKTSQA
jgi:hypothetical protein